MGEHYFVTIDRARMRIYAEAKVAGEGQPQQRLEMVEALDFPSVAKETHLTLDGVAFLTASSSDGDSPAASSGTSDCGDSDRVTDQRVSRRGHSRRIQELMATELDAFLRNRPAASWDFAAAPSLYHRIIDQLSDETRRRLKRAFSMAFANPGIEEVRLHFATAG